MCENESFNYIAITISVLELHVKNNPRFFQGKN